MSLSLYMTCKLPVRIFSVFQLDVFGDFSHEESTFQCEKAYAYITPVSNDARYPPISIKSFKLMSHSAPR